MRIRASILLSAAAAALLGACGGGSAADGVVGRWQARGQQAEFFDGGRLLIKRPRGSVAARWEMVDAGRMLVTFDGAAASRPPEDWTVSATRDSLVLCETDRPLQCLRYARAAADAPLPFAVREGAREPRLADEPLIRDVAELPVTGAPDARAVPRSRESGRSIPPEMRAVEAGPTLKQLYTLQKTHQAEHGTYARTLDELAQVGWQAHELRHFRTPRIASAEQGRLCIDIMPRAADLWPQHVDESGQLSRGPCR